MHCLLIIICDLLSFMWLKLSCSISYSIVQGVSGKRAYSYQVTNSLVRRAVLCGRTLTCMCTLSKAGGAVWPYTYMYVHT